MTLTELSELIDKPISIHYRTQPPLTDPAHRWYAELEDCETKANKSDGILAGTMGNGVSPESALADLVVQLRGKLLVVDAFDRTKRRELQVPATLKGHEHGVTR